ncbi:hypothetical protein J4E93_005014 [Alternaria ventricosa]|uniref:uncharacterized protein n=1 Tax=Alternaria ventricosa TaxID=1187951 RepID=UPI0020C3E095|nr:uncharacterized protein J4E93_005014 [Alternaria ventricosa]KAI4646790.1 hypothetical protein J4E93_005014 [Alternaria ventricosa]
MASDTYTSVHNFAKHVQAVRQQTRSLEVLRMDCTGAALANADVKFIASRNTQLREVLLHKASNVSDKGIVGVLQNCPSVSIIRVSGTEHEPGPVAGNFAGFLNQPDIVDSRTNLRAIYLEDQSTDELVIKGVSKEWRNLVISTATTVRGDVQSCYWLGGKRLKGGEERAIEHMEYPLPNVDEDATSLVRGSSEHEQSNANASRQAPLRSVQADADMSDIPEGNNSDDSEAESDGEEEEEGSEDEEDDEDDDDEDEDDNGSAWGSDDSDDIDDPEEEAYNRDIYYGRRAEPVYEPYEPAQVPPSRMLYYGSKEAWETRGPADIKRTGIQQIQFTDDLCVTDIHINTIAAASPEFRKSLRTIGCGCGAVSDAAVANLTRAVPSLKDIYFVETQSLTDNAIISIVRNCPDIERIAISGDDRTSGKVNCRGLVDVLADTTVAKKLQHLELWDQRLHDRSVKKISKARPKMAIVDGETVGDSMAAQMVAAQTGAGYMRFYLGGHLVNTGGGLRPGDFGLDGLEFEEFGGYGDFDSDGMDNYM